MSQKTFLITGASGKTGRRVAQTLQNQGYQVREAGRNTPTPFDWDDESTWAAALTDIHGVYVVLMDLGSPEAREKLASFAEKALAHGVTRAVLISTPAEGGMSADLMEATENVLLDSPIDTTVVRARWFSQNFSEGIFLDGVRAGETRLPTGTGREAFVDADDIAEVVVVALTQDGHSGKVYDITGPRLLSFADAIFEIGQATGRDLTFVPLTREEYIAEQIASGLSEEWARLIADAYESVRTGELETVSDDVEVILGKPARDFSDYAELTAKTDVWRV